MRKESENRIEKHRFSGFLKFEGWVNLRLYDKCSSHGANYYCKKTEDKIVYLKKARKSGVVPHKK